MKFSKNTAKLYLQKAANLPIFLLVITATLCVSSYLLAGWLMRPVGDDYASIMAYHTGGIHWLTSLASTILNSGGRYARTIVSVTFYGALGQQGLQLTAFMSVGLFLLAIYCALLAAKNTYPPLRHATRLHMFGGAAIFFLFYTMISVIYPWIRGGIDNTFQDLLWMPGFITYTLPFELAIILTSIAVLKFPVINSRKYWLVVVFLIAVFIGTFSETAPLVYTEALCLIIIGQLVTSGFKAIKKIIVQALPFICIACGLLFGLLLNYLTPATSERRALFDQQATLSQVIAHAGTSTTHYFSTYVIHSGAHNHSALAFIILGSMSIGLITARYFMPSKNILKSLVLLSGFSLVMTFSSVFICFVAVFKGYGIHSYLVPRFEIVYNIWLTLFLISLGFLIALLLNALFTLQRTVRYTSTALPLTCFVFGLLLLIDLPHVLHQMANRLQTVAVYSSEWQQQNAELQNDANRHISTATIPIIDIGDAYYFNCTGKSTDGWLGAVKQQYYHIPHICSTSSNP